MGKAFTIRASVPICELEDYMRRWERRAGEFVRVYSLGASGGWPILCAEFTDPSVPACENETALVIAQHSGMEITGMTTVLSVGNYLAALDERARKILRTQTVLLVPCPNAYSYAAQSPSYQFKNEEGVDEYAGSFQPGTLDLIDPQKTPAAAALKQLVDERRPEFLLDIHGVWYNEQIMQEFTGAMSFCALNRTFDRQFVDAMDEAAREGGYDVYSEDELQTLPVQSRLSELPAYRRRLRGGSAGRTAESPRRETFLTWLEGEYRVEQKGQATFVHVQVISD